MDRSQKRTRPIQILIATYSLIVTTFSMLVPFHVNWHILYGFQFHPQVVSNFVLVILLYLFIGYILILIKKRIVMFTYKSCTNHVDGQLSVQLLQLQPLHSLQGEVIALGQLRPGRLLPRLPRLHACCHTAVPSLRIWFLRLCTSACCSANAACIFSWFFSAQPQCRACGLV